MGTPKENFDILNQPAPTPAPSPVIENGPSVEPTPQIIINVQAIGEKQAAEAKGKIKPVYIRKSRKKAPKVSSSPVASDSSGAPSALGRCTVSFDSDQKHNIFEFLDLQKYAPIDLKYMVYLHIRQLRQRAILNYKKKYGADEMSAQELQAKYPLYMVPFDVMTTCMEFNAHYKPTLNVPYGPDDEEEEEKKTPDA